MSLLLFLLLFQEPLKVEAGPSFRGRFDHPFEEGKFWCIELHGSSNTKGFIWTLHGPGGYLLGHTTLTPEVCIDRPGTYRAQLHATDGKTWVTDEAIILVQPYQEKKNDQKTRPIV